jgi:hypothetical protein
MGCQLRPDMCCGNQRHLKHPSCPRGRNPIGDYDKLRNLVDPNAEIQDGAGGVDGDWYGDTYKEIYLASPGGDLAEAIKIGRLVRALRWETTVPSRFTNPYIKPETIFAKHHLKNPKVNYMCASACFFIFVAGVYRTSEDMDVEDNAILGIHRPFLTDADLRAMSGDQAISSANQLRVVIENYLKEMGVPAKYADLMLSIPKDDVQWIENAAFETDFKGIIPELRDWVYARCDKRTDVEKALWENTKEKTRGQMTAAEKTISDMLLKKMSAMDDCTVRVRETLRKDAWLQMFRPKTSSVPSWWRRIWQGVGMDRDR